MKVTSRMVRRPGATRWAISCVVLAAVAFVGLTAAAPAAPLSGSTLAQSSAVLTVPVVKRLPAGVASAHSAGGVAAQGGAAQTATAGSLLATSDALSDGFESGLGLWVRTGAPTWAATTYRASAGTHSAYCAASSVPAPGPYPNGMDAWMVAGPFDLSHAIAASFTGDVYIKSEKGYDELSMLVSIDGDYFYGWAGSGDSGGWRSEKLDLSYLPGPLGTHFSALGQSRVWVAFVFESDGVNNGEGAYVDDAKLSLTIAPAVTSVSPKSGPTSGGGAVAITGMNLNGATSVKFGGTEARFSVQSSSRINAIAPAHSAGVVQVTVTTSKGTSSTAGTGNDYTYVARPVITGLAPKSGPTAGGTSVTLTGTGLSGATAVSFGGVPASSITPVSATQLIAVSPVHLSGVCDVTVTTLGGTSPTTGTGNDFTYALTRYEESSPLLSYAAPWNTKYSVSYSQNYMRTRAGSSAPLTFMFTGRGFDVVATVGPAYGKLKVTIDGATQTTYPDLYAAAPAYRQVVYTRTGLSNGPHTVRLDYSGWKNDAASADTVNVDRLDIDGVLTQAWTRYEENSTLLSYAAPWLSVYSVKYSQNRIRTQSAPGAPVTFKFTGTGFKVIAAKGPAFGKLKVSIDGKVQSLYPDLYAAVDAYRQAVYTASGLSNATHTVVLDYSGYMNPDSSAKTVDLDALDIFGTMLQAP